MMIPKRKPVTPGYVFKTEFLDEHEMSQSAAAELMGVSRKTVNELVNDKQGFTVDLSMVLEKVFGTPPEFWLNLQRQVDLWEAVNSKRTKARIAKATTYKVRSKAA
jgi:addiction module HigA family antidote